MTDADHASLRESVVALRFRRDELSQEVADLTPRLAAAEPAVTSEKVERLAFILRRHVREGTPELLQAYVRLLLNEISVAPQQIRISGSKAVPAGTAAQGVAEATPAILSFVGEWRAAPGDDENYVFAIAL